MRQWGRSVLMKRLAVLVVLFTFIIIAYVIRLGWLQFIETYRAVQASSHTLLQRSVIQRERGIILDDGRGRILDRSGRSYTGQAEYALVLFPVHKQAMLAEVTRTLALWLHVTEQEVLNRWKNAQEPYIWPAQDDAKLPHPLTKEQVDRLQALAWDGVRALPVTTRYPLKGQTPQWVGAVAERADADKPSERSVEGVSGLERAFQPLLAGIGPTTFIHYTDALHRPLYGLDVRIRRPDNRYYPLQLLTTTSMELQRKIEQVMDRNGIKKGSVTVLDAQTRDVIAMVSRPAFDPNHVDPDKEDWNNRALKALPPGSIYKLFIAAAALDSKVTDPEELFHCDGKYGKYGLSCWLPEGHGALTLREALAKSCNVVFAELGERLDARTIASYASKLGVSGKVGMVSNDGIGHSALRHFDGEEDSRVFHSSADTHAIDGGVKAQLGIGQRDVRLTPLAAVNFVVTLLQDGANGEPRLVQEARYAHGLTLVHFAARPKMEQAIKAATARKIRRWMEDTVLYGTGQSLRYAKWRLAGKSGTAQADAYGTNRLHTWFVGYGPVQKPEFAVAVVSEEEAAGSSHRATLVFGEVMNVLAEHSPHNK
ncbi:peptidoglycan D,D-transpeptidase FtsI family protein [Paenibacillus apiarius]|uniref:peptidoglycan D,D-transpeptidase FtsI family protein n=1 Tax=Paenibacillus apiarius TaxID=46240 RepID=UPI003B3ACA81